MSAGFWAAIGLALLKLLGLLRGGKGYRATVEVRSEAVIAEERKHLEELKAEVRRIENELKALAMLVTTAIMASDGHRIIELNTERRKLHDDWDAARQQLLDFERYCDKGR